MGRAMKEWVVVPPAHSERWPSFAREALAYVARGAKAPAKKTPAGKTPPKAKPAKLAPKMKAAAKPSRTKPMPRQ
jgi:hypothetical protein